MLILSVLCGWLAAILFSAFLMKSRRATVALGIALLLEILGELSRKYLWQGHPAVGHGLFFVQSLAETLLALYAAIVLLKAQGATPK